MCKNFEETKQRLLSNFEKSICQWSKKGKFTCYGWIPVCILIYMCVRVSFHGFMDNSTASANVCKIFDCGCICFAFISTQMHNKLQLLIVYITVEALIFQLNSAKCITFLQALYPCKSPHLFHPKPITSFSINHTQHGIIGSIVRF